MSNSRFGRRSAGEVIGLNLKLKFLLLGLLALSAGACRSGTEEPGLPEYNPVFEHYRQLRGSGQDTVSELERISAQHGGTKIDAHARLQKAMELVKPGNIDIVLSTLESIINDFPGSREAMFARANIIYYDHETDFQSWKADMNELFQDAGAPSLDELWAGNAKPRPAPSQINQDEHDDLCASLIIEAGEIFFEEVNSEMVLNLDTYLILNYPERFDGQYRINVGSEQVDYELGPYVGQVQVESMDAPEFLPPILVFERPFTNGATVESPVRVQIRARDGTLSESSLMDLTTAEFIVDGRKVEQLYGKSSIENGQWECVLSIEEEFAPGDHFGVFRLSDTDGNGAELEFCFSVIGDRP